MKSSNVRLGIMSGIVAAVAAGALIISLRTEGVGQDEAKRSVLDRHEKLIEEIAKSLGAMETDIQNLQTSVGKLEGRVGDLEKAMIKLYAEKSSKEEKGTPEKKQ